MVLIVTIVLIVTALMILQRALSEFNLIDLISRPLRPLMRIFGLPDNSPFSMDCWQRSGACLWWSGDDRSGRRGKTLAQRFEYGELSPLYLALIARRYHTLCCVRH